LGFDVIDVIAAVAQLVILDVPAFV